MLYKYNISNNPSTGVVEVDIVHWGMARFTLYPFIKEKSKSNTRAFGMDLI